MFKAAVLASGSKGNSILVKTEKTKILLDAGLSGKKISGLINLLELDEKKVKALIVSHEHSDHIRGAGIICRKLNIPLYISKLTYSVIKKKLGKLPAGLIHFKNGKFFEIGDIRVRAFQSSHDVIDGSNFTFQKKDNPEKKLAVATDVGFITKLMLRNLQNCTSIILESNHDCNMLLNGSYPWELKQRIRSKEGHLSNEQAIGVISKVIQPKLKNLILAHLSEENNRPELAEAEMKNFLKEIKHELNLIVASQYEPTQLIDI